VGVRAYRTDAEDKAREGQALNVDADAAVLIVDLTESDIASELRHDGYREKFLATLKAQGDATLHGHTAIVFTETAGWHQAFIPWFLHTASDAPQQLVELLDPRGAYRLGTAHSNF
jgi:hypothetical protein